MSIAVTEPLTIAQTLDKGFQLFRKALPKVLPFTIIAAMLAALSALLFPVHKVGAGQVMDHPGLFWIWMLLQMVVGVSFFVAVIRKVDEISRGQNDLSLVDAYVGGLKWLPAALGGMFLYGLALVGGTIALLIPGIIWSLSLSFFWFFTILENQSPLESLKSSRALVRGNWWRLAAILSVALIVFMGLYAVVAFLAGASARAAAKGEVSATLMIATFITQIIVSSVSTPLLYSVQLIAFRELQMRKSGADLATRIAQAA